MGVDTEDVQPDFQGWLRKPGKKFLRVRRYFKLTGTVLSSHKSEMEPPSWMVDIADSIVTGIGQSEIMIEVPDQRVLHVFAEDAVSHEEWMSHLRQTASRKIEAFYTVGKELGRGPFSRVVLATHKKSCKQYAIKSIDKRAHLVNYAEVELKAMRMVDHPGLVKVVDFFDTSHRVFIVSEYLKGGSLYESLAKQDVVSEQMLSMVMAELLRSISYLHRNGFCHKNVKPGNLICSNSMFPQSVKLADVGYATFLEKACECEEYFEQKTRTIVTSPSYAAPELLYGTNGFDNKVDIWSCGIILYVMLSGTLPFLAKSKRELIEQIQACSQHPSLDGREWSHISDSAKDLVKGMLRIQPQARMSADDALAHPWITSENKQSRSIPNSLTGLPNLAQVPFDCPKPSKLYSVESGASQQSEGTFHISSETHRMMNVQKSKIMYRGGNGPSSVKSSNRPFESSEDGMDGPNGSKGMLRSTSDGSATNDRPARSSRGLARTSRGMSRLSKGLKKNVTLSIFGRGSNKDGPSEYW